MDEIRPISHDISFDAVSSGECAGMIPAALESPDALDSYRELAEFEGSQAATEPK